MRNLDHRKPDSEVKTSGNINHKNIIKIVCIISSQDAKLLVYKRMAKGNLYDWLQHHDNKGHPCNIALVDKVDHHY